MLSNVHKKFIKGQKHMQWEQDPETPTIFCFCGEQALKAELDFSTYLATIDYPYRINRHFVGDYYQHFGHGDGAKCGRKHGRWECDHPDRKQ